MRTRRTWRRTRIARASGTAGGCSRPCRRRGANRRLTAFGSVEALGRGRVEELGAGQDSDGFARYLAALEARHADTGREVYLVLDNGPCHRSKASLAALADRAEWLHVVWLARYCPQLNPKEPEWRLVKRDVRSHLADSLRTFVDEILAGLRRLGGERLDIVDAVPDGFLAGHRRPPTGRPPGRPPGSKDSYQRIVRPRNLPAPTYKLSRLLDRTADGRRVRVCGHTDETANRRWSCRRFGRCRMTCGR